MGIISNRAAACKPVARPHDPEVCGLGGDTECDACKAARSRADEDFYDRDAEAKERARRRDINRRFVDATGITLNELADALLQPMAQGMAEIAGAVLDERGAA